MSATLTAERLGRPVKLHDALNPLDLVELTPVMKLTNGGAEIVIGLIEWAGAHGASRFGQRENPHAPRESGGQVHSG